MSATNRFIWPSNNPIAGDVLKVLSYSNPDGILEWGVGSGGSSAGVLGSVQFNNPLGTFDGDANLVYDNTNTILRLSKPGSDNTNIPILPATASVLEVRNTNSGQDAFLTVVGAIDSTSNVVLGANGGTSFGVISYINSTGTFSISNNNGINGIQLTSTLGSVAIVATNGDIIFDNGTGTQYIWPTTDALANQILSAGEIPGTMVWTKVTVDGNGTLTVDPGGTNQIELNATTGLVTATEYRATSDIRLKKNIVPLDNCLESILQIEQVKYQFKKNSEYSNGVIAQQLEEIGLNDIVGTDTNGMKSVAYNQLIPYLIGAIKELNNKFEQLNK